MALAVAGGHRAPMGPGGWRARPTAAHCSVGSEPVGPPTTGCKQVVAMRMGGSLPTRLRYTAAQVPGVVGAHTPVCAAMPKGPPGKALRRILEGHRVQVGAAGVFWGWVAQGGIEGWLQLPGGGPQRGKGKPLVGWGAQATGAGGWGGMLAGGGSAWFASPRVGVGQQMLQLPRGAVPQVAQVWVASAKPQAKQANAGGQCRKIYDTALAQLHQQGGVALVGAAAKLLARGGLVAAYGTAGMGGQRQAAGQTGQRRGAVPQDLRHSTGAAPPAGGDSPGGGSGQAAGEWGAGGSNGGDSRKRGATGGTAGKGSGGCHQGSPSGGCGGRHVCRQTTNGGPSTQTWIQVCGGGGRRCGQCSQGLAEGGCFVGFAAGGSSRAGGSGCADSRCPGSRDTAGMGIDPMQHSKQAGPRQPAPRLHSTQRVPNQGGGVQCALGSQLLPVPAHILEGYQRVDHSGSMEAKGLEWHRSVQGGHRLLQQEQEEDRGDQRQDRTVEPRLHRRRAGIQGIQGTSQGRDAEQGASKPAEGAAAGNVTAVQGRGGVVTEDMMEAMHRTESVQVATRRRRAGATGFEQNFKNNLLPD